MHNASWTAVDSYFESLWQSGDVASDAALAAADVAGLPRMQVAPNQGRMLELLARSCGARKILEIGTLGGYSALFLARALPSEGRLITLEREPRHAEVALANIARAGYRERVEVRVGLALDSLAALAAEGAGPFDFVFIDADKTNLPAYFDWAVRLARPGSLIVVDNVVRNGAVVDAASTDPSVVGVRQFATQVAQDPRVAATALQTVGAKGYDGFALAVVLAAA